MLDRIIETIGEKYDLDAHEGVFLSVFDNAGKLLWSHGSVQTSKPLQEVVTLLYSAIDITELGFVVVDIVWEIVEHTNKDSILQLDMKQHAIFLLSADSSGVILPDTVGIDNPRDAIAFIKKKYNISGKVRLYSFTTDRMHFN